MTTSLKKMKTGLGSEPVYEITVEYYKTDTDGVHNYRDVYGYVTNISVNNENVFFNYKTKSIFAFRVKLKGSFLHSKLTNETW